MHYNIYIDETKALQKIIMKPLTLNFSLEFVSGINYENTKHFRK
jgi:hypothetical protein